jgi:hypothetical protein
LEITGRRYHNGMRIIARRRMLTNIGERVLLLTVSRLICKLEGECKRELDLREWTEGRVLLKDVKTTNSNKKVINENFFMSFSVIGMLKKALIYI